MSEDGEEVKLLAESNESQCYTNNQVPGMGLEGLKHCKSVVTFLE